MSKRPVAIVAMGRSYQYYILSMLLKQNRPNLPDDLEVWAVNTMGAVIKCDRVYHMDPVAVWFDGHEWTPETEAHGRGMQVDSWPAFAEDLKKVDVPVYTAVPDPRVPTSVRFPVEDVVKKLGLPYFNTTVAYAVAHAIYEGRPMIHLYGCDFHYKDSAVAEAGRACVEYWLGQAIARKIKVFIPNCTLLDNWRERRVLYGYGKTLEEMTDAASGSDSDGDGRIDGDHPEHLRVGLQSGDLHHLDGEQSGDSPVHGGRPVRRKRNSGVVQRDGDKSVNDGRKHKRKPDAARKGGAA